MIFNDLRTNQFVLLMSFYKGDTPNSKFVA